MNAGTMQKLVAEALGTTLNVKTVISNESTAESAASKARHV
jgi:hypothetical protein